jgi:hypothetical protein
MPPITHHTERTYESRGVRIELPATYGDLERASVARAEALCARYPKTWAMWNLLDNDPETLANWDMADFMTVNKLSYNDHGRTHALIAAANAVVIFDLLREAGLPPDVVTSTAGDYDDACLTVAAAALLHDIGNQVHRKYHEMMGVGLARAILDRLMPQIYPSVEQRVELRGFILHAILSHDFDPPPLTFEAGVVAIADGTDVTKGRGRKAFDLGKVDIHSVSALAIDEVHIQQGAEFPVEIMVVMNNSAGIFQIDETLTRKVVRGPLARYVTVVAVTRPEDAVNDARIIQRLKLRNGIFVSE